MGRVSTPSYSNDAGVKPLAGKARESGADR
jgi:hypothetical protein